MKYPAIYKSVEGSEYLYKNKDSYYCYERQVWDSSEPHHDCHHSDTNITAEYLANTYGEVKSKEHAEFIVKLAEVNGIVVFKDSEATRPKDIKYFSVTCDGILYFWSDKATIRCDRKQITIPLPPECEEKIYRYEVMKHSPKHFDCVCTKCGGRCCIGDCDEWPKVGLTVEAKHDSGQVLKGELLAITSEYAIIQQVGHEQHLHLSAWALSKPKTPEQELRDEISNLAFNQFNDDSYDLTHNSYYLAEQLISKYNIAKKGEGDEF